MINFFDIDSVESFSNARREKFMREVEQDRISRVLSANRQTSPNRFRRATGVWMIQMGARLSGDQAVVGRRSGALT